MRKLYSLFLTELNHKTLEDFSPEDYVKEQWEACESAKGTRFLEKLGGMVLLRQALLDQGIEPHKASLTYGPSGKPFLVGNPFYFSISHSRNLVICVIADQEVGADVEQLGRKKDRVISRFFHPEEVAWYETQGKTDEAFVTIWTRKEAYLKWLGEGAHHSFGQENLMSPLFLFEEGRIEDYHYAVYCEEKDLQST